MFEKGYGPTGIKEITDQVDIPKGSFYNHFDSKEEFGLKVLEAYVENGTRRYEKALLETEGKPLDRLKKMFENITEEFRGVLEFRYGCLMGNFSAELADINDKFQSKLESGFLDQQGVIVKVLKEAKEGGELEGSWDAELLGSFIINSWHGAMLRMKASGDDKPLKDFQKVVFDRLI